MRRSAPSPIKLTEILRSSSSRKKGASPSSVTGGSELHMEMLFHLSTMMSIAQRLGYNMSFSLSERKE